MLTRIGSHVRRRAVASDPWTNVYGVARSILALSTCMTLVASPTGTLFVPAAGIPEYPQCSAAHQRIGLFCLLPSNQVELLRWGAVALLVLVASGWRPRVTGLLHWWVSYSLAANAMVLDGGDTICSILTLLLVPVTLTDVRVWHWQARAPSTPSEGELARRIVALSVLWLIRLQVAGIYFHAAVAKLAVPEWVDGTVLYYVFNDPVFGAASWLTTLTSAVAASPLLPVAAWMVLLLEYLLSAALLLPKERRGTLLVLGVLFHGGIIVLQGLMSFGLTMIAALILFLRPVEHAFSLPRSLTLPFRDLSAGRLMRGWQSDRCAKTQTGALRADS
jgi:sporulation delaying protein B